MKFTIGALLLVTVLGFNCSTAKRYDYTYGAGFDVGLDYSGSRQFGVHAKDGTYSVFTDGTFKPNIYGSAGVFMPHSKNSRRSRKPHKYNSYRAPMMPLLGKKNPVSYYSYQPQVYPQNGQNYAVPSFTTYQVPVIQQNLKNYPVPYRFYWPQDSAVYGQNVPVPANNPDQTQKHQD